MMLNSRGQLGKIFSTFVVMILIFILLGIYLILSGYAFTFKGKSTPGSVSSVEFKEDLMIKKVNIKGEEMLVIDALRRHSDWGGDVSKDDLKESMKGLVLSDRRGYCMVIALGDDGDGVPLFKDDAYNDLFINSYGLADEFAQSSLIDINKYRREEVLRRLDFIGKNGKTVYVSYYYGGCLE